MCYLIHVSLYFKGKVANVVGPFTPHRYFVLCINGKRQQLSYRYPYMNTLFLPKKQLQNIYDNYGGISHCHYLAHDSAIKRCTVRQNSLSHCAAFRRTVVFAAFCRTVLIEDIWRTVAISPTTVRQNAANVM